MNTNPKISVVVSTYNRPEFLQRAVDSVLMQSFKDFEIIIVDDHSDKNSELKLPDGESRVIGVKMPWNTGYQVRPKNVGIMCASNSYTTR